MKENDLYKRVLNVLAHAAATENKSNPDSKAAKEFTEVYMLFRNNINF